MAPGAVQAQEWWLSGLGVKQSWKLTEGAGVTVAVLGTGVAASQPDLAGSVFTGPDYTGSGRTPGGPYWGVDGTAAAAIIAGHGHGTGGETGLLGVAPAARILSVRVSLEPTDPLRSDQAITSRLPDAIADGIIYAVRYGARIIDLPLAPASAGQPGTTPAAAQAAEQAAVKYAVDHGTVLVAPAGDAGQVSGAASYPAAYPGVVAVGAVARDGQVAGFSARHGYVAVTAPGVNLVAANPDGGYPQISSTSTSSAIVAGVAALVWSRFPQLTAAQVRQALTGSATVTNAAVQGTRSSTQAGGGHGTVDAARAVALAASIARSGQPSPAASASRDTASPAAAPRPGAGSLARSLVRDVVAGAAVLIVLLAVLLVAMRSRRDRAPAEPGRGRPRGQHEQRKPERGPGRGLAAAGAGAAAARTRPAAGPGLASAGPGLASAGSGAAAPGLPPGVAPQPGGAPPAAASWRPPGGWQGTSVGEIAAPRAVPAVAPAPKPPRAGAGSSRKPSGPSGPPWAPAPEPERLFGPLPVAASSAMLPDPGPGIRVPGDMNSLAGSSPDAPAAGADFPPRAGAQDPDFPPRPVADGIGPSQDGHPALPTRARLGFAAAPIQADYVPPEAADMGAPPAPDFTVPSRAAGFVLSGAPGPSTPRPGAPGHDGTGHDGTGHDGTGHDGTDPAVRPVAEADIAPEPAADPSYIWDLAGHDVFPAADPARSPAPTGHENRQGQDPD